MAAAVPPQASRAGLITTVVVLCITTLVPTILCFTINNELTKSRDDLERARRSIPKSPRTRTWRARNTIG